ncbi:MAG TPA: hypothetical protein VFG48_07825 [Xanthomonadales bacterium]|nr:hypothetical protein [Xanthomonadales bacterium]
MNFARIHNTRILPTISEPGFGVSGTSVATREGSMRIGIDAEGRRVFSEGLHNGQAWRCTPRGGFEQQDAAAASNFRVASSPWSSCAIAAPG